MKCKECSRHRAVVRKAEKKSKIRMSTLFLRITIKSKLETENIRLRCLKIFECSKTLIYPSQRVLTNVRGM